MGDQEVNAALEAARRLEKNLDVRRNPDSIAASVIYMAIQRAGADQSIRDVSTATGVSEVTIREVYYKDLRPHAELLFG
jgi:transcription initiation factor TFIIB